MRKIIAVFLAILFCLTTACAASNTSGGPDAGASPADTSLTAATVSSADETQSGTTDDTSTATPTATETPTESESDPTQTEDEEDPIYSETLLSFSGNGHSYDIPYGLYRYFYCSYRDYQLSIDPEHYSSQNVETDLLLDADKYATDSCREVAAYFLLAKLLDKLPENFDEEFDSYYSMLTLTAAYYGVTVEEYLGGYLPKSALYILYEMNYAVVPAVDEALSDEANGYIGRSDAAIAALAAEYRTVKHILVGYSDGLSDEEALALANELIARYKNGEDFDSLIETYSNDYHAGTDNIYTFTHGDMVPEFEQTAFELEENELSEPVRTAYGYHVILRLPLSEDFAENDYLTAAVGKYVSDFGDSLLEIESNIYKTLTDEKLS